MLKLIGRALLVLAGTWGITQTSSAGTYVRSNGQEVQADDSAINIVFVNGIKNNKRKLRKSSEALIQSLKSNGLPPAIYTFSYFYNPTNGILDDTGEVARQQVISDAYLTIARGDLQNYYSMLGAYYNNQYAALSTLTGAEERVVSIAGELKRRIVYTLSNTGGHTASKGMLLVPHSQGNLYAEAAYAMLVADGNTPVLSKLRIVGVAVASATTPFNRYITHDTDQIVGTASAEEILASMQSLLFRPLSANQVACPSVSGLPECGNNSALSAIDGTQHGFAEIYLNTAVSSSSTGETFPKIIYDLVTISIADIPVPPVPTDAIFEIRGTITQIPNPTALAADSAAYGFAPGIVQIGDPFTFRYTVNTIAPDQDAHFNSGAYRAIVSATLTTPSGTHSWTPMTLPQPGWLFLLNDFACSGTTPGGGLCDRYQGAVQSALVAPYRSFLATIFLEDADESAFGSDAIPTTLDGTPFESAVFTTGVANGNGTDAVFMGTISSVVRVP